MIAGNQYRQVGSDVMAPKGDITIAAKQVDIVEARETSQSSTEHKFKQSGLSVSISNPVVSAVQTGQQMAQAAGNTGDTRMQALAAASAAAKGYNAYSELLGKDGNLDPAKAGDISLSISLGSSKSQSQSASQSDSARGSSLIAGNNVTIVASGAGQASNLTVQGSTLTAGNNASLIADNQISLLASQSNSSHTSSNSSSSSSIGMSVSATSGIGFNASASKGSGQGNGQDTTYTNSQVNAGNTVILQSGGDTTLKGAVIAANQVKASAGGNLTIQSLQDASSYQSRQTSSGGSLSVSVTGIPTGGGISAGKSSINSTYQSVSQTSGIQAGDGGFQVSVGGHTDLKGGVIASSQDAVDSNKNRFTTGGALTLSDIENTASYEGKAAGISIDVGQQAGQYGVKGVGAGLGSDKGSASSTTTAGVSGIAGNTAVRTGDAQTGIKPIFDAARVQRDIDAQAAITQAFSREAPKAVASYAGNQAAALRRQGNEEEAKKWDEGGIYRVALHTAAGAFSGGASGAAGAAASASAAPLMEQLQDSIASGLQNAGIPAAVARGIATGVAGLTAAGVGAAIGGSQGAVTALAVDANNRQLHPTEAKVIKDNAQRFAKQIYGTASPTSEQIEAAVALLANTAQSQLDNNLGYFLPYSMEASDFLQTLKLEYVQQNGSLTLGGMQGQQQLFYASIDQQNQPWLNQGLADASVTSLIIKTPISAAVNNPSNDPSRDKLTGLTLDEKGRYGVNVSIDGKNFEPKYFSCAMSSCIASGKNLDMNDPGTQAYVKAVDKMILDDINKGATIATIASPMGVVGTIAQFLGPITSVASGIVAEQTGTAIVKEAVQAMATQYMQRVYGFTEALAIRVTATVDLVGGWQALVDRTKREADAK